MHDYLVATGRSGAAALADAFKENLVADAGAEYDQVIEIDLTTLEPHINGPFTPDLAHPLSKFADALRANGWPTELKVGACTACVHTGACMAGRGLVVHAADAADAAGMCVWGGICKCV
jgi:aconitate hydratase